MGWTEQDSLALPYITSDGEPRVIRLRMDGDDPPSEREVIAAVDELMGGTHPEACRRARLVASRVAWRIAGLAEPLLEANATIELSIRVGTDVDPYGSTRLDAGDPFDHIGMTLLVSLGEPHGDRQEDGTEGKAEGRDERPWPLHGTASFDIYDPEECEPSDDELIVTLATVAGDEVPAGPLGKLFCEARSDDGTDDGHILLLVDETVMTMLAVTCASALPRATATRARHEGDAGGDGNGE